MSPTPQPTPITLPAVVFCGISLINIKNPGNRIK